MDVAVITWPLIVGGQYSLPAFVTWMWLSYGWPKLTLVRIALSVLIAWIISVLFTAYVFNPVGYAYLVATQGEEYAFNRFDNNNVATAVLGGWMIPVIAAVFYFVALSVFRRFYRSKRSDHGRESGVSGAH